MAGWLTVEVDGREVEAVVTGASDGIPLVYHHGTPAAAPELAQLQDPALACGLRTVFLSRPGYAGSTPRPGRSVADVVDDVVAVLDELGDERFLTLGWSGGGPHALACAALLPGRCAAAATLAGVAPREAAGLDWTRSMADENLAEFGAAETSAEALTAFLEGVAAGLADVTGAELADALGGLVPEVDRVALHGELGDAMAESFRRAVSTGIAGWRDDDLAFVRPWGVDLQAIAVPVAIWQGSADRMVPFAHGQWLATHVPNAVARLEPGEGHLSLVPALARILVDLRELAAL
jgi:pimeloyl-ACP methyl ester carboxylesterase